MEAAQTGHLVTAKGAFGSFGFRFPSGLDDPAAGFGVEAAAFSAATQPAHEGDFEKWAFFASTPQSGVPSGPLACLPLTRFFFFLTFPACTACTDAHCEQVGGSENRRSCGWAPQSGPPSGPGACPPLARGLERGRGSRFVSSWC